MHVLFLFQRELNKMKKSSAVGLQDLHCVICAKKMTEAKRDFIQNITLSLYDIFFWYSLLWLLMLFCPYKWHFVLLVEFVFHCFRIKNLVIFLNKTACLLGTHSLWNVEKHWHMPARKFTCASIAIDFNSAAVWKINFVLIGQFFTEFSFWL